MTFLLLQARNPGDAVLEHEQSAFRESLGWNLARDVGFQPSSTIEDGVARFVAWYRQYHGR